MPIPTTLNTNEVKNAAGSEVEFALREINGGTRVFRQVGEPFNRPHSFTFKTEEVGEGFNKVRKTMNRIDKVVASDVDPTKLVRVSTYTVVIAPCGALTTNAEVANVFAELGSFNHTLGTNTHVYDGTAPGAKALINGDI